MKKNKNKKLKGLALKSFIVIAVLMMLISVIPSQAEINKKSKNGLGEKVNVEAAVVKSLDNSVRDYYSHREKYIVSKEAEALKSSNAYGIKDTNFFSSNPLNTRTAGAGWTEWASTFDRAGFVAEIVCSNIDSESDSNMEIVYTTADGYVNVHEWAGTADTVPATVWISPDVGSCRLQSVCVADADKDGKKEVIAADVGGSFVNIFEYSGTGGLSATNPSTTPVAQLDVKGDTADQPHAVWVGDQDGDGAKEIWVTYGGIVDDAPSNYYGICYYECTGDNIYTFRGYADTGSSGDPLEARAVKGSIRSLDGPDGRLEVVVGSYDYVLIYEYSPPDDTFVLNASFELVDASYINSIDLYDIDGDGDEEIFVGVSSRLYMIYATADNTYTSVLLASLPGACWEVRAGGNLDGDSYREVYVGCGDDKVYIYERTGTGLTAADFTNTSIYTSAGADDVYGVGVCIPDYDQDGMFEVMIGEPADVTAGDMEVFVIENNTRGACKMTFAAQTANADPHQDMTASNSSNVTITSPRLGGWSYLPYDPFTPLATNYYPYDGVSNTTWLDVNISYSYSWNSTGSTSTHRWNQSTQLTGTVPWDVASKTETGNYYEQWIPSITLVGTSSPNYLVNITARTYFGTSNTPTGLYGSWSDWCDAGSTLTFNDTTYPATPQKNTGNVRSWTVNSAFSATITYGFPSTPANLGVQGYLSSTSEILNITDHTPDLNYTYTDADPTNISQVQRNVSVYDSNWNLLWHDNSTQSVTSGTNVIVTYAGPSLSDGNDYYFNVTCNNTANLWCSPVSVKFHMNTLPTTSGIGVQGYLSGTSGILNITNHTPAINWTYTDSEGSTQSDYNVSVWTGSGRTGTLMGF
ncbi:MAG: VCBS repeat-containing protein, partial [Candidatus Thermoplasmatota archaeon]|nr:VCBS repeat-containing protein [Candidatus Thermoplasmatota archaeon]